MLPKTKAKPWEENQPIFIYWARLTYKIDKSESVKRQKKVQDIHQEWQKEKKKRNKIDRRVKDIGNKRRTEE